ncbi:LLM class flavin-dependent oxidoreductase [Xanthomonas sp. NCPPB 2632]|uniref:LLM class flavin-dependent oxidoreductase n=1 Tax=Xanthomonas sp. NCPPB 2632 TaxID=3240912 RepID=UPI0035187580
MNTTFSFLSAPSRLSPQANTHAGFDQVFANGRLTFGLIAPLESYPHSPAPTMKDHLAMAQLADQGGFSSLWLRDVPFYDPTFRDVGQVFDPMAYAGYLACATSRIALGTAGIVMPLRDPLAVAKQATTLDHLTDNRFILGLASGDRPVEYPVFGVDYATRSERFRDAVETIRAVTGPARMRGVLRASLPPPSRMTASELRASRFAGETAQ